MKRHFDDELKVISDELLKMSILTEKAISDAVLALKSLDRSLAQKVIDNDTQIDEMEIAIEKSMINLLALRQPLAADLRFITTGIKINSELERIADLAADIAGKVLEMPNDMLSKLEGLEDLTDMVKKMVKTSIDSFVLRGEETARNVIFLCPKAISKKDAIQKDVIDRYMLKDSNAILPSVNMLFILRHLERICAHATNIAEDIIYMVGAKRVKHHLEKLDKYKN